MAYTYFSKGISKPDDNGKIKFEKGYLSFVRVKNENVDEFKIDNPDYEEINDTSTLAIAEVYLNKAYGKC